MSKKRKKFVFEVEENESIDDCMKRIKEAGCTPVRRIEKPIFLEVKDNGNITYKPVGRKIIFETVKAEEK